MPEKSIDQYTKAQAVLDGYVLSRKMRNTPERNFLLSEIYKINKHFDVEELHRKLSKSAYHLSKATLYNSLDLFVEAGVVVRHYLDNNTSVYEKAYGQKQHDHFVCNRCKTIVEFCDPRLYLIKQSLEESLNIKISSHNLYLYGICSNPECQD